MDELRFYGFKNENYILTQNFTEHDLLKNEKKLKSINLHSNKMDLQMCMEDLRVHLRLK